MSVRPWQIAETQPAPERTPGAEEQFRCLFDVAGDGLLIHSWETGAIIDANPAANLLYGYAHGEMIGLRPGQLACLEDLPSLGHDFEVIRHVTRHGGDLRERRAQRRKDGAPITVDMTWRAIPFAGDWHLLSVSREAPAGADPMADRVAKEERLRLARELHDSVCQTLYGISLGAHTAATLVRTDPARATESINYLLTLSEAALKDLRALVRDLRADDLPNDGLVVMLRKLADHLTLHHGLHAQVDTIDEPVVPLAIKDALYRIAREAASNTVKHASASHLTLSLLRCPRALILEIADDGAGFDPILRYIGHFGLQAMTERLLPFRGSLEINSQLGHGTRVRARVPLPGAEP